MPTEASTLPVRVSLRPRGWRHAAIFTATIFATCAAAMASSIATLAATYLAGSTLPLYLALAVTALVALAAPFGLGMLLDVALGALTRALCPGDGDAGVERSHVWLLVVLLAAAVALSIAATQALSFAVLTIAPYLMTFGALALGARLGRSRARARAEGVAA